MNAHTYRDAERRTNPTPWGGRVGLTSQGLLMRVIDCGWHATREEALAAARAEAKALDARIQPNGRLERMGCRPIGIDWGCTYRPFLDP